MNFSFAINADLPHKILCIKVTGFCAAVEDFLKYEQAFLKTWQAHFGNAKIKLLIDQRDYQPTTREVTEHVIRHRQQVKGKVLASAVVVGVGVGHLQMQRIVREADTAGGEKLFTDYDEALQWLKKQ